MRSVLALLVVFATIALGCSSDRQDTLPIAPDERTDDEATTTSTSTVESVDPTEAPAWLVAAAADTATTFEFNPDSFTLPAPALTAESQARFDRGDELFDQFFHVGRGLGPDFNAEHCTGCHHANARQRIQLTDGSPGMGVVIHLSQAGADETEMPFALPGYGTRLQNFGVHVEPEGTVEIEFEFIDVTYPDGTVTTLRSPVLTVTARDGALPADAEFSIRIPQQVAGPGLLERVPAADIEAAADPDDTDGDGISGEVQWVPSADGTFRVGRHGWKAENADLLHQVAGALAEDMGISTSVVTVGDTIEMDDDALADLTFYVDTLAVPGARDNDDPTVIQGANLFESIGCATCHTPQQRTVSPDIPEFDGLEIYPFTDLLLHDLGPGLADDRPVLHASGSEWRTAPLWGIGLLEPVNGHASLLHDGRARSVEEAILWHGGEAEHVTDAFMALTSEERAAIIAFVESR